MTDASPLRAPLGAPAPLLDAELRASLIRTAEANGYYSYIAPWVDALATAEARAATLDADRARERERRERAEKLNQDAAMTLAFGIDGTVDRDAAYTEAFTLLYGDCFGPGEVARILAEGRRAAPPPETP